MNVVTATDGGPVQIEPTDDEVTEAALRLTRLIDRPASVPVLGGQLKREMHYWLLAGRHGPAIRRLGLVDSHAQRIGRAVALIRAEFKQLLPVERLADAAGMSPSSFHQHFRAVTSLSPLQFQKAAAAHRGTAADVGGGSVSQQRRARGRLRKRLAIHARVWTPARPTAGQGQGSRAPRAIRRLNRLEAGDSARKVRSDTAVEISRRSTSDGRFTPATGPGRRSCSKFRLRIDQWQLLGPHCLSSFAQLPPATEKISICYDHRGPRSPTQQLTS